MANEPLKIKKRGEDGNKVITVRIKEDTLAQLDRVLMNIKIPLSASAIQYRKRYERLFEF